MLRCKFYSRLISDVAIFVLKRDVKLHPTIILDYCQINLQ